uniref:Uncharacterized protein n=1 Tax=Neogobius melanostomus TaxID=47308 RepID=A0A8C6TEE4_9GOBI
MRLKRRSSYNIKRIYKLLMFTMGLQAGLSAFVYFTFLAAGCLSTPQHKPGCFKVNNCKCIMKDGSGVISLRAMADQEGFLGRLVQLHVEQKAEEEEEEKLLSFSPCQPFSQPELVERNECINVAACLYVRSPDVSRFLNYGRHDGNEFHYNDTLKVLSVSYFSESRAAQMHVTSTRLSAEGPLHIWVESPCACPNACAFGDLGLGTIYLIILCVSAVAYFVLGSCALRPFRSSSGVQISPEPSVWCMICYHCSENRPKTQHDSDLGQ